MGVHDFERSSSVERNSHLGLWALIVAIQGLAVIISSEYAGFGTAFGLSCYGLGSSILAITLGMFGREHSDGVDNRYANYAVLIAMGVGLFSGFILLTSGVR